jgi:hypothetical protein
VCVTRWWVGEPANETEKGFRRDAGSSAARTTKSAARCVGRRYRDEPDSEGHAFSKHLRRLGLQLRKEGSRRRNCGRANNNSLRHEAHAAFAAGCAGLLEQSFMPGERVSCIIFRRPTVCVTRWWAGRGNAILTEPTPSHANCQKRGDSHQSGARCVGRRADAKTP